MRRVLVMGLAVGVACGVKAEGLSDEQVGAYVSLALAGIDREFPNKPAHVWESAEDAKTPKEWNPVFYGHFDWHSSVHGHWTLVRLLRLYPEHERMAEVRKVLEVRFAAEALQKEADYLADNKSFERMYGWAWALRLGLELRALENEQGREWAKRYRPVEEAIVGNEGLSAEVGLADSLWVSSGVGLPAGADAGLRAKNWGRGVGGVGGEEGEGLLRGRPGLPGAL